MLIIHKNLINLPLIEKNDFCSQMCRASKSIPTNIAEGWARRNHEKEFRKHLECALGSANEMEVHLDIAKDLKYWNTDLCQELIQRYKNLGGKLNNLRKNWKS